MNCPMCGGDVTSGEDRCIACGTRMSTIAQQPTIPVEITDAVSSSFEPGGQFADRFTIIECAGEGGMGVVYKAIDQKLESQVALKLIQPALCLMPSSMERFRREVRVTRQLTHPNICRVHDIGEHDGQLYLTMEWVDGETLQRLLRQTGTLTEGRALQIAARIADAIGAAHDTGVVHRDLKPANIMIDRVGRILVMDFGLAREEGADTLTGQGLLGTPLYMSPEQRRGETADPRSDLYALGVILTEMICGKRRDPYEPVSNSIEGMSPVIRPLIEKLLAPELDDRFQNAAELSEAIQDLLMDPGINTSSTFDSPGDRGGSSKGRPAATSDENTRSPIWGWRGVLALIVVLAFGSWVAWEIVSSRADPPAVNNLEARRLFQQGQRYEERGYTTEVLALAEHQYRDALDLEPGNPMLEASLANLLVTLEREQPIPGRPAEARELVDGCLGANSAAVPVTCRLALGRLQLLEGDVESAIVTAREVATQMPNDHRGFVLLGEAMIDDGKIKPGQEQLKQAMDIGDGHIWARASYARSLVNVGEMDKAAAEYAKVLDYAPDFANALNNLGAIYLFTGRYLDAINAFERLLQIQPDSDAASNLGTAYFFLDQMDKAIAAYTRAVELNPKSARSKRNLGEAYEASGDLDSARQWYTDAAREAGDAIAAGSTRTDDVVDQAFCFTKLERFDDAMRSLETALVDEPDNMFLLFGAAMACAMAEDRPQLFDYVKRAVRAGYPREYFHQDPAFAAYTDDAEFIAALTEAPN